VRAFTDALPAGRWSGAGCRCWAKRSAVKEVLLFTASRSPTSFATPFPPPALPGFDGTTSLSATPRRPGLSRAGVRLRGILSPLGFPVLPSISLYRHAVAITPVGPPEGSSRSPETCDRGLPRVRGGSAPQQMFRGPLGVHGRYGLPARGTAFRSFPSKASALARRFDCYRLERQLPGGNHTH
jgi:hypothetical protein